MSSFDSACLSEVEVCCGHFLKLVGGGGGGGGGGGAGGGCPTISSFRPTSFPESEVICFRFLNLLTGGGGWGGCLCAPPSVYKTFQGGKSAFPSWLTLSCADTF